jgi:glycosyltransferase involved in cell wall biosynthesis
MSVTSPSRILEITSYPPPRAGWGVRVQYVKEQLESMGHTCVVLNTGKSRKIKSDEYETVENGLDYVRKVIRFSHDRYMVHTHVNGDSPKGLVLTLLAQVINLLFGRRCVLTFHAGPMQKYFPQERSRLFAPVFRLVFKIPRTIVCNSEAVKAKIVTYGVDPAKVVPIPAFSRQYLQFHRMTLSDRLEGFIRDHDPVLSTYAFFRPEFYLESLIDSMKLLVERLPRLGLIVMGSDAGSEAIAEQIRSLGLQDNVMLAGDLPHDEFLSLLTRTRMYIRTPSKDGVCSSVLEALSLRVPVVASENGTRPAGVVTFKPNDAEDLAARVSDVLRAYDDVRQRIPRPEIRDTVLDEALLLSGAPNASAV